MGTIFAFGEGALGNEEGNIMEWIDLAISVGVLCAAYLLLFTAATPE
ncbi:MAG: hypothetical protein AB7G75_27620 [Candidatus Binatia bacterium]